MANVTHASLTGSNLHEPKGVANASNNQVYVANGAGSGVWTSKDHILTTVIDNVSSADKIYSPIPYAGTITRVVSVLEAAIASSNATITVKNAAAATMGTITVAHASSAAGNIDTLTSLSNNTVANDSFITIETNGASSNTAKLFLSVVVGRS